MSSNKIRILSVLNFEKKKFECSKEAYSIYSIDSIRIETYSTMYYL